MVCLLDGVVQVCRWFGLRLGVTVGVSFAVDYLRHGGVQSGNDSNDLAEFVYHVSCPGFLEALFLELDHGLSFDDAFCVLFRVRFHLRENGFFKRFWRDVEASLAQFEDAVRVGLVRISGRERVEI